MTGPEQGRFLVPRMLMALLVGAGALVLATAAWFAGRPPEPPPVVTPVVEDGSSKPTTTSATLTVYVTGEVLTPGLVAVLDGSRVADAIAAAGGATAGAVLSALNLAAPLTDGMQIVVPSAAAALDLLSESDGDGRVRVNRATAEELQQLPGVGPVLAERIVAHREAFGPFEAVEDLLDVPGIGEGKLASLRDAILLP